MKNLTHSKISRYDEIVFVCSGNIIRSAFAELLAKNLLPTIKFSSCGTVYFNNQILHETKVALISREISSEIINNFKPTHITNAKKYNLNSCIFFGMTNKHLKEIRNHFGNDANVRLLRDLIDEHEEVEDPYFTNNFDLVFDKISECIFQLEKYLIK
ncbi:MAG: Low molecular weight protein-tyrosine-phosphatase PtpB [Candidatus Heimdallarchaeota archaeon LC_2]|nr:MAG: Low molecular weight protein-tyrosine-phosphatase PtpB [Candidatus Heimdallarchaeota archaeon LC_2]